MKKKRVKGILQETGEDLALCLLIVLICFAIREVSGSSLTGYGFFNRLGESLSGHLLIMAFLILGLTIYGRYISYVPVKLSMSCTRKQLFMDIQLYKLLTAGAVCLIGLAGTYLSVYPDIPDLIEVKQWLWGFLCLITAQSVVELLVLLYLKIQKAWLMMAVMVVLFTAMGAGVGYTVGAILNGQMVGMKMDLTVFREWLLPIFLSIAAVCFLVIGISWNLMKKIESRI